MRHSIVPLAVLVVLPITYFAWRLGFLRKGRVLWVGGAAIALLLAINLPFQGVDFIYIKRLNLFIAAAAVLLMLLRYLEVPWILEPGKYLTVLVGLAVTSAVVYLNFFSFHGERTYIHYHDVAHYYLGSKYFRELGYTGLYTGMLRAEAEIYDNHFKAIKVRDLSTGERVHVRLLLEKSDPVKNAFTPERWLSFKKDVAFFRQALDRQYGKVLLDHGYNPTPFWAVLGGMLANRVPAGSHEGILILTLLDPLLLIGSFAAIGWAFGRQASLLSLILFCIVYGATFGWTGGAFGRYPWLFGVVVAMCCMKQNRYLLAGGLLAGASLLRIFPMFFLAGILFGSVGELIRARRVPSEHKRLLVSFAGTAMVLFLLTGVVFGGFQVWEEFGKSIDRHMDAVAPNLVGLTGVFAYQDRPDSLTPEEFQEVIERRSRVYRIQLVTVFAATLLLIALMSQRQGDVAASVMGILLLFTGLNLAAYYYVILILFVMVYRDQADKLALIFGTEVLMYSLLLFEDREGLLYVYRSLLLLYLLTALYLEPIQAQIGRLTHLRFSSVLIKRP